MKNKKAMKIGLIGTAVLTVGVAMALIASNTGLGSILKVRGIDHDANCEWNHYDAVAATYAQHGSKEFWACCSHAGQHVLTAPSEGHITDIGPFVGDYFDNLDSSDDRYIAKLAGNAFMHINVDTNESKSPARSKEMINNVTGISFKYRLNDITTAKWFGFGLSTDENPNVYPYDADTNPLAVDWKTVGAPSNDGEWHATSLGLSGSGYLLFLFAAGEFDANASIDIDDIVVQTSSSNVEEDFEESPHMFRFMTQSASLDGEPPEPAKNKYIRVDVSAGYSDQALVRSLAQYPNVTKVSMSMRANVAAKQWQGASVNTTQHGADQYTGMNQNNAYENDGEWHVREFAIETLSGYVNIISECGHFVAGDIIDYDNIVIEYGSNQRVVETFEDELIFEFNGDKCVVRDDGELLMENTVTAIDATRTSVETREYTPTFDVSTGTDDVYGPYVQLDNWKCKDTQERCWIGFTQTTPLGAIKAQLNVNFLSSYILYIYNPLNEDFSMMIMCDNHYSNIATKTLKAKAWTKVEMTIGMYGSYDLQEAHQIGFDHNFGSEKGVSLGSGWKFTSIYADEADFEPPAPVVNPAPFGVVALDAQTGYFRDTKGYNAPHTDSHGIDDDYGAYIQIDDWACPSGASHCWLTFSDTARAVADIETDLGKSITNYFFYIYNPLAENFTFKIMLKSSSGMNPNMNVACVAGAWTKVTVAYGQADNGSYPALTSASQIGLTQVLSNGAVVGSGWKVTSVYAE